MDARVFAPSATLSPGGDVRGLGESVAIAGSTLVVGSLNDAQAYVFTRRGQRWSGPVALAPGGESTGFASSVAIAQDAIVVGVPGQGSAQVYARQDGNWAQETELRPGEVIEGFGQSVSISDDTIVVGAPNHMVGPGAAYVFARSGSAWSQQAKLAAGGPPVADRFGGWVSVDADTAVVGRVSLADIGSGSAFVFVRSAGVWSQQAKLTPAGSGAVGAPDDFDGDLPIVAGDVVLLRRLGFGTRFPVEVFMRRDGTWSKQTELQVPESIFVSPWADDALALTPEAALVASTDDRGPVLARLFARDSDTWSHAGDLVSDGGDAPHVTSVALDGETAAVAHRQDGEARVDVFSLGDLPADR